MNACKLSEEINYTRRRFLGIAAMTIAGAQLGLIGRAQAAPNAAVRLPNEGKLPSLGGATEWLNSQPLTPVALRFQFSGTARKS